MAAAVAPTLALELAALVLWALAWLGSTPVGGPIVGWVGQVIGARWVPGHRRRGTVACGVLALPALTRIDRRPAPVQAEPGLSAQGPPNRLTSR